MKKFILFMCWVVSINLMMCPVPVRAVGDEIPEVSDSVVELPTLYIRAVNPGYKVEGVNNVGEMIEIARNSDDMVLLAGMTVSYTNTSGKEVVLMEFPEYSYLTGESIQLRLASSALDGLANLTYTTTLAMKAGPLKLIAADGGVVDEVCWTGKDGCVAEFKSANPTALVRNLETGGFEHMEGYEPEFSEANYEIILPEPVEEPIEGDSDVGGVDDGGDDVGGDDVGGEGSGDVVGDVDDGVGDVGDGDDGGEEKNEDEKQNDEPENLNQKPDDDNKNEDLTGKGGENSDEKPDEGDDCKNLAFSEILTYWVEAQTEQFLEIYNASETDAKMDACQIKYKNKFYPLSGVVGAKNYVVRYVNDFKLTKNPKSSNVIELLDSKGKAVDVLEYQNGQKKGTSLARIATEDGEFIWRVTYEVTPGAENVYQEYRSCGEGQYLNPLTGRCKKIEDDEAEEKVCEEGYYLNEETGRCRKIVEEKTKTCAAGQYLNPLTGRCKKIEVEEEKVCEEGYYLNEATGRCRKIVENNGADYELAATEAETYKESSSFVALYAVLGVVGAIVLYIIYEFRRDILKFMKRILRK